MRNLAANFSANTSWRWKTSFPFILALISVGFLFWSAFEFLTEPFDGIEGFNSTGLIYGVGASGPASGKLERGDMLVSVSGIPFREAIPLYIDKQVGDEVLFHVKRDGRDISVSIILETPPLAEKIRRLTPLFVAFIFWIMAVGVQTFGPAGQSTQLFFLFCLASSTLLSTGALSETGPPWIQSLYNVIIWLIGPLTVHFHLHFPQNTGFGRQHILRLLLYAMALLGGLPFLIWGAPELKMRSWYSQITSAGQIFVAACLLLVVALLFYDYRHTASPGVRGKIRIVVLGGALSALPLITLNILPSALLNQPLIPNTVAFLLLGIIPLTYGYAIFRHRLIEIEKHVNRGATFILVYSTLGSFYLVLYVILHNFLPASLINEALINTALVLALATVFVPLHRRIQRTVDTVFYGGWYDYRSAIIEITQGMEQIAELETLASTIGERLVKVLRLEDACVFLRDVYGDFSIIDVAPRDAVMVREGAPFPVLPKNSLTYLLKLGAVERNSLREALKEVALTPEERQLLNTEQVHLWIPIIGHGQILGLLALGPKFGGDIFSGEDMDILRVVARQIAPLIENIHLVTRLKRHAANLERRVAERTEELHAAKERVEAILSSVGDGVVVTDLNWKVITVNTAFEQQYGYAASEILGQEIWSFFGVDDQEILDEIQKTLRKGSVWSGELINHRKDGSPLDVQLAIAPVRDQKENVMGYVGSQRDITHNKQLDRLKDRLIFDVSHELRTPVTNLNLYVELLENGRAEKKADYISVLKSESHRLIDLIESILDLSRLDMWKSKKMKFSAVNLNFIVEQVVDAYQPLAESGGLSLRFVPDPDLPPIRGEPNQLARLITNLLSNSIRYTLAGEIELTTCLEHGQACLKVRDTGIGIEAEDIPHLFDRFYRGRQVSQSKIAGTGLGLAIAKEIVEIHEGKVDVESQVGRGTEFTVFLPLLPHAAIQEAEEHKSALIAEN